MSPRVWSHIQPLIEDHRISDPIINNCKTAFGKNLIDFKTSTFLLKESQMFLVGCSCHESLLSIVSPRHLHDALYSIILLPYFTETSWQGANKGLTGDCLGGFRFVSYKFVWQTLGEDLVQYRLKCLYMSRVSIVVSSANKYNSPLDIGSARSFTNIEPWGIPAEPAWLRIWILT